MNTMSTQKDATVRAKVPMTLAPTRSLDDLSTALFSRGLLLSACTTHTFILISPMPSRGEDLEAGDPEL